MCYFIRYSDNRFKDRKTHAEYSPIRPQTELILKNAHASFGKGHVLIPH